MATGYTPSIVVCDCGLPPGHRHHQPGSGGVNNRNISDDEHFRRNQREQLLLDRQAQQPQPTIATVPAPSASWQAAVASAAVISSSSNSSSIGAGNNDLVAPEYADFYRRFASFNNYPAYTIISCPRLATAGFYYKNQYPEDVSTHCYACGFTVESWDDLVWPNPLSYDPFFHHAITRRDCYFVNENLRRQERAAEMGNDAQRREIASLRLLIQENWDLADKIRLEAERKQYEQDKRRLRAEIHALCASEEQARQQNQPTVIPNPVCVPNNNQQQQQQPPPLTITFDAFSLPPTVSAAAAVVPKNNNTNQEAAASTSTSAAAAAAFPSMEIEYFQPLVIATPPRVKLIIITQRQVREKMVQLRKKWNQKDKISDFGIDNQKPFTPDMSLLGPRKASYKRFPFAQLPNLNPEKLAQAGLFYTGREDAVQCFFCRGTMREWEPQDDPALDHARWYPNCLYVRRTQKLKDIACAALRADRINQWEQDYGPQTSDPLVRYVENPIKEASVEAVVAMGYSPKLSIHAWLDLADRVVKTYDNIIAEDIIDVIVDLSEEEVAVIENQNDDEAAARGLDDEEEYNNKVLKDIDNFISSTQEEPIVEDDDGGDDGNSSSSGGGGEAGKYIPRLKEYLFLAQKKLCKVCYEKSGTVVMLPCRHMSCCADCFNSAEYCPQCQYPVRAILRTYGCDETI